MRVHYFQHVPFEGLGSIEEWLVARGHEISRTRFFAGDPLPAEDDVEMLIIMGGPMSVNDIDQFPWLAPELEFIRRVILTGKPVLGVCLGAQLIARSMGGKVYPNRHKEIGWFPVEGEGGVSGEGIFCFPPSVEVFHWHGETFDLPPGAVRLARNAACENQAFQLDGSVIGLQFHLETTLQSARDIVHHCRDELQPGQYIQGEEDILAASLDTYAQINRLMGDVLSFLARE